MNHSKRSNALLYVFASVTFTLLPAGFAAAQEDTSPPELVDFSFTPAAVDVTSAPRPVTFRIHIHDPLAGYRGGIMSLLSASGQHQFYIAFWDCPPVDGDYNDGTCEVVYSVPKFIESGTWRIAGMSLVDRIGNGVDFTEADLTSRNFPTELDVTSNPDYAGPELVDFSFSPSTVDVSGGPQPVLFNLRISDLLAGYRGGIMSLLSASGQHQFYIAFWDCPPVDGDYNDGLCEVLYSVPQFIESGTWRIAGMSLVDRIGNGTDLTYEQLAACGLPNELLVVRNQPPTANAGADQTVECANPSGTPVRLDGSLSSDPNAGDTLTYRWTGPFSEGGGFASGVSPVVTLPLGSHTITLTVDDGNGGIASDTVAVTVGVSVAGLLPPLAVLVPEGQFIPIAERAFKRGSTLPIKLRLYCGGTLLTAANVPAPRIVALGRSGEPIDLATVDVDAGQANENDILFRFSDGNWIYNLSSRALGSGTYTIVIELPDRRRFNAGFVLR